MSERYNALDLKARTSATIQGASEAVEALQQCGVAAAHVHNGRTLAEDPHLAQRGVYDEVEHGFWLHVERDPDKNLAPALGAWRRLKGYLKRTLH